MTETFKHTIVQGRIFNRVDIPATGEWQLLEMKRFKVFVLVHPNGRQAWFHERDLAKASTRIPNFRYTNQPLRDLQVLAKRGNLRPFHVDADFDPTSLLQG
jgi:hypothetical protein